LHCRSLDEITATEVAAAASTARIKREFDMYNVVKINNV
jgi:hypothetical protein